MLRRCLILLAVLIAGCASMNRLPTDYAGPDVGRVVLGLGADPNLRYTSYTLLYRSIAPSSSDGQVGRFEFWPPSLLRKDPTDYSTEAEVGVVRIHSLRPGRYEIFRAEVYQNNFGTGTVTFSSKEPFSIPFVVTAGRTTYLGNYQASNVRGRNLLGMPINAGAIYAVSNRGDSDLRIARLKDASIGSAVDFAVPNVRQLANPWFVDATR